MIEVLNIQMALAGSPAAWAALGVLVILVFAPRLLPSLARVVGLFLQREVRRRLGMPEAGRTIRSPKLQEVIPPGRTQATRTPRPEVRIIDVDPLPRRKAASPLWWAAGGVLSLLAVLSWILFHSR